MAQPLPHPNVTSSTPPHGGSTDPNDVRRRMASNQQTGAPGNPHGQAFVEAPAHRDHGGNTDPNEIRRVLASNQPPPNSHSNGQTPSASPQLGVGYTPPIQQQHPSPAQYSPNPGPPSQSYFGQANQMPHNSQNGQHQRANGISPLTEFQSQTSGLSQSTKPSSAYVPYQPTRKPVNGPSKSSLEHVEAVSQYQAPAERGYANLSHDKALWRWKWPNSFQLPTFVFPGTSSHHRDVMQRAGVYDPNDYYLSPTDGHLAKLFVQSTQEIYTAGANSTWRRTFIRNRSPFILQVAEWVLDSIPEGREATGSEIAVVAAKWLPSCFAILILMTLPINASGEIRNGGYYDPFPYKYWGYPYHARNSREDRSAAFKSVQSLTQISEKPGVAIPSGSISERPIEPIYLCFLEDHGRPRQTLAWKNEHKMIAEYIFVSYTSEQFPSDEDQLLLHDIGEHAARTAGVPAYWVGCACLGDQSELEENVYRISDVIRGAHSMVIVVSEPSNNRTMNVTTEFLLKQWGSRVWTLPEVLLSPNDKKVLVYARGADVTQPLRIDKKNFTNIWADAPISRELIDHFEGTLILSQLELQTIALSCFHSRQKGYYLKGDMAYALMGLMRKRPLVVRSDSAFQAFARLSLANDNDLLLERLLCILPQTPDQPWYNMGDQWDVALWDIYPKTQICGIGDSDTVILDGARAAAIRWKSFSLVASLVRDSWKRFFARYSFRSTSYAFYLGVILIAVGGGNGNALTGLGAFFLAVSLIITLLSPYLIRAIYTGKLWDTQPWFFGFEGYMPLSSIERHIFGGRTGHLKWSTASSPLSVHAANSYGECIGQDPTSRSDIAERVRRAAHAPMGEERIFTLVDTYTLTVTLFAARRPPVAVVLCGEEGGMQRAMLCSYDWQSQTLYRESVLRMETPVEDKMARVGRLKFGFSRDGGFS